MTAPIPPELLGEPWGDTSRIGLPFAKDPSVVRFGGRYLLYFSLPPTGDGGESDGWRIGVASSVDLIHWTTVAVLEPFGGYDSRGLAAAGAIVLGQRVHLFYQSYGNGASDAICHATSEDGVAFTADPSSPVFSPTGDWNCGRAIDADVVVHGDRLMLAWATRDPGMEVQMIGLASAPVDSDLGRDSWTDLSIDRPALRPELDWERDCVEAPALRSDGTTLTMIYAGGYNNEPQQIGWATSSDGVDWTRGTTTPFIPNGASGTWNSSESGHPGIFTDADDSSYLFFQGNDDGGRTYRIAATRLKWTGGAPELAVPAE